MIEARHIPWAERVLVLYLNRLFRKHFSALRLFGKRPLLDPRYPVLLLPNHSTWWDGFFIHLINRNVFNRNVYLMMLERQLMKFSFFSKVGAFGIDPDTLTGVRASIRYSANILKRHSQENTVLLCLFPQGILQPWTSTQMEYKSGFLSIIRKYKQKITLLQMGIKATYLEEQYPEVFFIFGEPEIVGPDGLKPLNYYRSNHKQLLSNLEDQIRERNDSETLFLGKQSISQKIEQLKR